MTGHRATTLTLLSASKRRLEMFFHASMFLLRYLHLGIIFILLLKAGCDEIWEKICSVQGKDPSVDFTQVSKLFNMRVNKKLKLGVELLVC